jgi:hypothetical protein
MRASRILVIGLASISVGLGACGAESSLPEPSCEAVTCSGHGACAILGGQAVCDCQDGYAGQDCSACADGYTRGEDDGCAPLGPCAQFDCGSHGVCDARSGQAVCRCDPGWAGTVCDGCAAGYVLDPVDGCSLMEDRCTTTSCSGHGWCDDSSGSVVCSCLEGYQGLRCDRCGQGFHLVAEGDCVVDESCLVQNPCGEHGACRDAGGIVHCECDPGFSGALCDECAAGHHPDPDAGCVEDEHCPVADPCEPHGTCEDSTGLVVCVCETGYGGEVCDVCSPGYIDQGGLCLAPGSCHEYPFEQVAYLFQLILDPQGPACCHDLDGDGRVDNSFRGLAEMMGIYGLDLDAALADAFQAGSVCRLFELRALDSSLDDPQLDLIWFGCADPDGDASDNLSGQEPFTIGAEWFEPDGQSGCSPFPLAVFDLAVLEQGQLLATAQQLSGFPVLLPLPIDPPQVTSISLHSVVLEAGLVSSADGVAAVDGMLSGGIALGDLVAAFNDFAVAECGCLGLAGPLFDLQLIDDAWEVTCGDTDPACSDQGLEASCVRLEQFCAIGGPLLVLIADLDLDGDDLAESISIGLHFDSVPAVAAGITP